MTADPSQYSPQVPAWFVCTVQGVVLAGPFLKEADARAAGNRVAANLRTSMRGQTWSGGQRRYSEADVAARVGALRVAFGVTVPPHGGFAPR